MNETLEARVWERTASLMETMGHLEEFSYTVSHDLRAPARAMKRYAEIALQEGGQLAPEIREYLDRIIRGGTRMERLVEDVLTYSRLARRELTIKPVQVEKVVRDIIDQYPEKQAPRAKIGIAAPMQAVQAHEATLAQGVSNLLLNAVKFIREGEAPEVVVRTEERGWRIRIWVEDKGIGISSQHLGRVFGIFERLHPDMGYEGTGIGLAIVRKVAERMEGTVGVDSDGVTGSRFWIELPAGRSHE